MSFLNYLYRLSLFNCVQITPHRGLLLENMGPSGREVISLQKVEFFVSLFEGEGKLESFLRSTTKGDWRETFKGIK
jgi:hypothetical protein